MEKELHPGSSTDAIITLLKLSHPPERQEGEGISIPEAAKALRKTKHKAKQILDSREDLLPVQMTNYNGRDAKVYMPKEDAETKYPDWIVKESS